MWHINPTWWDCVWQNVFSWDTGRYWADTLCNATHFVFRNFEAFNWKIYWLHVLRSKECHFKSCTNKPHFINGGLCARNMTVQWSVCPLLVRTGSNVTSDGFYGPLKVFVKINSIHLRQLHTSNNSFVYYKVLLIAPLNLAIWIDKWSSVL